MSSAQQRGTGILPVLPFKTRRLPEGAIPSETSAKRPACSADFQVARLKPFWVASLQPERLTDISQPRSGWNAGHQRPQVLKGQGKDPSLRRPFRDEKYFRMLVQALRAWLISGGRFATNASFASDLFNRATSKSAVSRISKSADLLPWPRPADLEVGDTAGLETCATQFFIGLLWDRTL